MSDSTVELHPDALFVIACPICQGQVAATGSLRGHDACCPLCASLFHVPFPKSARPSAEDPEADVRPAPHAVRRPQPASGPSGLGEDWGPVIEKLAPPQPEPKTEAALDQPPTATFEPPPAEPSLPEPALADLAFREPLRTVRVGDALIELRRLSPEERRSRRFRRNLLMIAIGISILLAIVVLAGFPRGR